MALTVGGVLSNLIEFDVTDVVVQFHNQSQMFGFVIAHVAVADSVLIVHHVLTTAHCTHASVYINVDN